ncbi:hypothetical protein K0M31_020276 [Melipona bicolor]|uniref:Uncharacterized protein n=1 Tax=Melipona bicolor TaxID=60889 RepID=A0AA40KQL1_9HYME|nr:hypothetical protein K0M31_020276 [Melipona bicolor]
MFSRLLNQAVYHDKLPESIQAPENPRQLSRLDDKGPLQGSEGLANDHRHFESGNHNPSNERADQKGYQLSSTRITVTGNTTRVGVTVEVVRAGS